MTGRRRAESAEGYPFRIGEGGEKYTLSRIEASPCSVECPLETDVKAYVSLIAAGRFEEALEVVRRTNPFPGICGRVCPHPCEDRCLRGQFDEPIAIAALKRFLADYELRRAIIPRYSRTGASQGKVAVIGAGPAGLTCAADLAREGYSVTVFESRAEPGGMLANGIPPYRLPREILRTEIAAVEACGVEILLNSPVGEAVRFEELTRVFDAVFVATGAMRPKKLNIPGEEYDIPGILNWVFLLRHVSEGRGEMPGDRVIVIGGGNTAVDCARSLLRLGSRNVQLLYRRSRVEMPASTEEVEDAQKEGVKLSFLTAPVKFTHNGRRVIGLECVRMRLGDRDESGRKRPIPIPDSRFVIPCDAVVPAIGQELDAHFLGGGHGLKLTQDGLLDVDHGNLATSRWGVFAGGDAVNGSASVVEAIAAGHRAARSIIRFLSNEATGTQTEGDTRVFEELAFPESPPKRSPRVLSARRGADARCRNFEEVDFGFTELEAMEEAKRCLRCGPCRECTQCVGVCEKKQVILEPLPGAPLEHGKMMIRIPLEMHREFVLKGSLNTTFHETPGRANVFVARVNERLCRGCGLCEEVCEYKAVQVVYRGGGIFCALINGDMCRGCGTCTSVCPTGAMDQYYFSRERMLPQTGIQSENIVIYRCLWAESPLSLTSRGKNTTVEVMCIGSVAAGSVLRAFEKGAWGVLLVGCGTKSCHYGFGRRQAEENMRAVWEILSLLGINQRRLRIIDDPGRTCYEAFLREIEGVGPIPLE